MILVAGLIGLGVLACVALAVYQPGRERRLREVRAGDVAELKGDPAFPPSDFLLGSVDTQMWQVTVHVKDVNDVPYGTVEYRRRPLSIELSAVNPPRYVVVPRGGWREVSLCRLGADGEVGEECARYFGSRFRGGAQRFTFGGRELRVPGGWKTTLARRCPIYEGDRLVGLALAPDWASSLRFTLSLPNEIPTEVRLFVFAMLVRCLN